MTLDLTTGHKHLFGMIHLAPLPGTPFADKASWDDTLRTAVRSASALADGGADGCLVQSVDRVYSVADESDPARTAAMALIVSAIRQEVAPDFRIGVQLMRNALRASLAVACVAGGSFIRANALVGSTMSPSGLIQADPLSVMAYRRQIDAWQVRVIADIDTMHFRWFGEDKPLGDIARAARLAGADAVAVSDPDPDRALAKIEAVRAAAGRLPVVIAGHTSGRNAVRLLGSADAAFVGTAWEREGWGSEIDADRVRQYVDLVRGELP